MASMAIWREPSVPFLNPTACDEEVSNGGGEKLRRTNQA